MDRPTRRRPIDPTTGEPRPRLRPGPKPRLGVTLAPLDVSPEQAEAIRAAAAAAGLSVAEWLRRAAAYCVAVRVPLVSAE